LKVGKREELFFMTGEKKGDRLASALNKYVHRRRGGSNYTRKKEIAAGAPTWPEVDGNLQNCHHYEKGQPKKYKQQQQPGIKGGRHVFCFREALGHKRASPFVEKGKTAAPKKKKKKKKKKQHQTNKKTKRKEKKNPHKKGATCHSPFEGRFLKTRRRGEDERTSSSSKERGALHEDLPPTKKERQKRKKILTSGRKGSTGVRGRGRSLNTRL